MKWICGFLIAAIASSAWGRDDDPPVESPPSITTTGGTGVGGALPYSLSHQDLGAGRRRWNISFFGIATAADGSVPTVTIRPMRDGDEIGVLNALVNKPNTALPRVLVTITSGLSGQKFRNVCEVQGISSGQFYNNFARLT